jgi:hypothetical protein
MTPWSKLEEGKRTTIHYTVRGAKYTATVSELPSGTWWAGVKLEGACTECLGDNFLGMHAAMAACELHVLG